MTSERIGGGRPKLSYFTHRFHPQFIDFFQALLNEEVSKSPISDGETKGGKSWRELQERLVESIHSKEDLPKGILDITSENNIDLHLNQFFGHEGPTTHTPYFVTQAMENHLNSVQGSQQNRYLKKNDYQEVHYSTTSPSLSGRKKAFTDSVQEEDVTGSKTTAIEGGFAERPYANGYQSGSSLTAAEESLDPASMEYLTSLKRMRPPSVLDIMGDPDRENDEDPVNEDNTKQAQNLETTESIAAEGYKDSTDTDPYKDSLPTTRDLFEVTNADVQYQVTQPKEYNTTPKYTEEAVIQQTNEEKRVNHNHNQYLSGDGNELTYRQDYSNFENNQDNSFNSEENIKVPKKHKHHKTAEFVINVNEEMAKAAEASMHSNTDDSLHTNVNGSKNLIGYKVKKEHIAKDTDITNNTGERLSDRSSLEAESSISTNTEASADVYDDKVMGYTVRKVHNAKNEKQISDHNGEMLSDRSSLEVESSISTYPEASETKLENETMVMGYTGKKVHNIPNDYHISNNNGEQLSGRSSLEADSSISMPTEASPVIHANENNVMGYTVKKVHNITNDNHFSNNNGENISYKSSLEADSSISTPTEASSVEHAYENNEMGYTVKKVHNITIDKEVNNNIGEKHFKESIPESGSHEAESPITPNTDASSPSNDNINNNFGYTVKKVHQTKNDTEVGSTGESLLSEPSPDGDSLITESSSRTEASTGLNDNKDFISFTVKQEYQIKNETEVTENNVGKIFKAPVTEEDSLKAESSINTNSVASSLTDLNPNNDLIKYKVQKIAQRIIKKQHSDKTLNVPTTISYESTTLSYQEDQIKHKLNKQYGSMEQQSITESSRDMISTLSDAPDHPSDNQLNQIQNINKIDQVSYEMQSNRVKQLNPSEMKGQVPFSQETQNIHINQPSDQIKYITREIVAQEGEKHASLNNPVVENVDKADITPENKFTVSGASSPYGTKQTVSHVGHEEEAEHKAGEADSKEYNDDRSEEDHNGQNSFQQVTIEDIHNKNDPSQVLLLFHLKQELLN